MQGGCVTFPTRMNQSTAVEPKMWHKHAMKCYQWEMTFRNVLSAILQSSWNSCLDPRTLGSVFISRWHDLSEAISKIGQTFFLCCSSSFYTDEHGITTSWVSTFVSVAELRHMYVCEIYQGGLWQSKPATVLSRVAEVYYHSRTTSVRESTNFSLSLEGKRCRKVWRFIISQCFTFHFALFSQSLLVSGTTRFSLQTSSGYKMHWNIATSSYFHL